MKTRQEDINEIQNHVNKVTRRKWFSLATFGAGALLGLDYIVNNNDSNIQKPEMMLEFTRRKRMSQSLNWAKSGSIDYTNYQDPYINQETERFFDASKKYNTSLDSAIVSVKKDISKLEKNPEIINYQKLSRKEGIKGLVKAGTALITLLSGLVVSGKYINDIGINKRYMELLIKWEEENQK